MWRLSGWFTQSTVTGSNHKSILVCKKECRAPRPAGYKLWQRCPNYCMTLLRTLHSPASPSNVLRVYFCTSKRYLVYSKCPVHSYWRNKWLSVSSSDYSMYPMWPQEFLWVCPKHYRGFWGCGTQSCASPPCLLPVNQNTFVLYIELFSNSWLKEKVPSQTRKKQFFENHLHKEKD